MTASSKSRGEEFSRDQKQSFSTQIFLLFKSFQTRDALDVESRYFQTGSKMKVGHFPISCPLTEVIFVCHLNYIMASIL